MPPVQSGADIATGPIDERGRVLVPFHETRQDVLAKAFFRNPGIKPARRSSMPYIAPMQRWGERDRANPFDDGSTLLPASAATSNGAWTGLTLQATVNPDFGQVKQTRRMNLPHSDDLPEKRPFS